MVGWASTSSMDAYARTNPQKCRKRLVSILTGITEAR